MFKAGIVGYLGIVPLTSIGVISGTVRVGSVLTAGVLSPAGATASYQWSRCLTVGGSYTNIGGATSSTYTLVSGDLNYYLKVTATGTGSYSGVVTSAATTIVLVQIFGFKTQWTVSGDSTARTITLPLVNTSAEGSLVYSFTAKWGDGTTSTITSYNDANRVHTYASNGTYDVEIIGTMEGWSFNNTGDISKLVKILNWGESGIFNGFKYLYKGFNGCSNLTTMPASQSIPVSGTGVLTEGFGHMFSGCTSLTNISTDLFKYHTSVTSYAFTNTFNTCSALTAIPVDLFKYNTAITTGAFTNCFYNCTTLTTIPVDLFRYNINVDTQVFYGTFNGCNHITAIPSDLFKYNTGMYNSSVFANTFYGCTAITSIPAHLFDYNPSVTGTLSLFYGTGITSIPANLFDYFGSVTNFESCFCNCVNLTTIPTDFFKYNVSAALSGFRTTFAGCSKLTAIPTDLFKYNTFVGTNAFNGTFSGCSLITSIPTDLFRYNTGASTGAFMSTFSSCIALTTIPTDLFRYNTAANTSAFNSTFSQCTALATVPTYLFRYNTVANSSAFNSTFQLCDKLQLNADIFCDSATEKTTRFLNKSPNFSSCFTRTAFTGTQGVAPDLWNYTYGTGTPIITTCYGGAGNSLTSLSNYASVPAGYK